MPENAQKLINDSYPKERRSKIRRLNISDKNLEGSLDLSDFVSLEKFNCSNNQLTNLILSNLTKLQEINCSNNKLTDLDLSSCSSLKELHCRDNKLVSIEFFDKLPNPEELVYLNISDNNFSARDLHFLSKFINLEKLFIGNNEFCGSLKFLGEMNNLEELDISDTNVDSGLEYLPKKNLKEINCEINKRPEACCRTIKESLRNYYNQSKKVYNYKD